jgi:sugar lactone lactonase YvrE
MKTVKTFLALFLLIGGLAWTPAWADDDFPKNVNFETLVFFGKAVEGLTGDNDGNLYTTERADNICNVHRIDFATATDDVVGHIGVAGCSPSGIAFDENGDLFIADGSRIYRLTPNVSNPAAVVFAENVPGANGVAFDKHGNLWTGDGTTGQGRVWKIAPCAVLPCAPVEVFRVQPMNNSQSFGGDVLDPGVGRVNTTIPGSAQNLVANGLAFTEKGDLFVADTARGAIWKVRFKNNGDIENHQTGCDTTFTANTLCLDRIFVAHPYLEGTDGIALDKGGNIWNSVNERNAIVVVTTDKEVIEIFRNSPDGTTHLRNTGPLEFPTSPFLLGKNFCTANADSARRDNGPNAPGELPTNGLGKISCMDKKLKIGGLRLPVD